MVLSKQVVDVEPQRSHKSPMHEQNMAIAKSLACVAWADGVFAAKEQEMIEGIISAFEASPSEAETIRAYSATQKTLEDLPLSDLSADDRRVLLQHAILLIHVDGEVHEKEKQFVNNLCQKLHIPENEASPLIAQANARAERLKSLL